MAFVEIPDNYLEILKDFGDVHDSIRTAVKRYIVELTTKKMEIHKNAIETMESKYGCDYRTFISLSVNNEFRKKVLDRHKDWKADLLVWEKNTQDLSSWVEKVALFMQKF